MSSKSSSKPLCSLSLDLDNKWSYMQTHGDSDWQSYPSYLEIAVPRILQILKQHELPITFFIVGKDAEQEKNWEMLAALSAAGHEIASHSHHHRPWLHLFSEQEIDAELALAEEHIERVTGQRPLGFRGPGFSISEATLRVLQQRGYRYDATAFPNILNPLARAYFFSKSNLTKEQKEQRKALFGTVSDAFRPNKPYYWQIDDQLLTEIPVTTTPVLKVPFHFSYLLYLSGYSIGLARQYFKFAVTMCQITRTQPSILMHPLDFMGSEDDHDLAFFPGMQLSLEHKLQFMEFCFDYLEQRFALVTMQEHVAQTSQVAKLRQFQPVFKHLANDSNMAAMS